MLLIIETRKCPNVETHIYQRIIELIIETQKCPNVVDAYLTIDRNLWKKQFKLSRVSNYFAEKIDK